MEECFKTSDLARPSPRAAKPPVADVGRRGAAGGSAAPAPAAALAKAPAASCSRAGGEGEPRDVAGYAAATVRPPAAAPPAEALAAVKAEESERASAAAACARSAEPGCAQSGDRGGAEKQPPAHAHANRISSPAASAGLRTAARTQAAALAASAEQRPQQAIPGLAQPAQAPPGASASTGEPDERSEPAAASPARAQSASTSRGGRPRAPSKHKPCNVDVQRQWSGGSGSTATPRSSQQQQRAPAPELSPQALHRAQQLMKIKDFANKQRLRTALAAAAAAVCRMPVGSGDGGSEIILIPVPPRLATGGGAAGAADGAGGGGERYAAALDEHQWIDARSGPPGGVGSAASGELGRERYRQPPPPRHPPQQQQRGAFLAAREETRLQHGRQQDAQHAQRLCSAQQALAADAPMPGQLFAQAAGRAPGSRDAERAQASALASGHPFGGGGCSADPPPSALLMQPPQWARSLSAGCSGVAAPPGSRGACAKGDRFSELGGGLAGAGGGGPGAALRDGAGDAAHDSATLAMQRAAAQAAGGAMSPQAVAARAAPGASGAWAALGGPRPPRSPLSSPFATRSALAVGARGSVAPTPHEHHHLARQLFDGSSAAAGGSAGVGAAGAQRGEPGSQPAMQRVSAPVLDRIVQLAQELVQAATDDGPAPEREGALNTLICALRELPHVRGEQQPPSLARLFGGGGAAACGGAFGGNGGGAAGVHSPASFAAAQQRNYEGFLGAATALGGTAWLNAAAALHQQQWLWAALGSRGAAPLPAAELQSAPAGAAFGALPPSLGRIASASDAAPARALAGGAAGAGASASVSAGSPAKVGGKKRGRPPKAQVAQRAAEAAAAAAAQGLVADAACAPQPATAKQKRARSDGGGGRLVPVTADAAAPDGFRPPKKPRGRSALASVGPAASSGLFGSMPRGLMRAGACAATHLAAGGTASPLGHLSLQHFGGGSSAHYLDEYADLELLGLGDVETQHGATQQCWGQDAGFHAWQQYGAAAPQPHGYERHGAQQPDASAPTRPHPSTPSPDSDEPANPEPQIDCAAALANIGRAFGTDWADVLVGDSTEALHSDVLDDILSSIGGL